MKIVHETERLSELLTTYVIGADEVSLINFWDNPPGNRLSSTPIPMIPGGFSLIKG